MLAGGVPVVEQALLLLIAAILGCTLIYFAAREFCVGLALVFVALYVREFIAPLGGVRLGVEIYPLDAIFLIVMCASGARFLYRPTMSRQYIPWLCFSLLAFVSFGLGIQQFGATSGVVFRKFFYFVSVLIYCASFRPSAAQVSVAIRWWLYFTLVLTIGIWMRWVVDPAELGISWIRPNSWDDLRVSDSDMALMVGQAAMLMLILPATGQLSAKWKLAVPLWLITVGLLQHRSVWLATLAGLVATYYVAENRGALFALLRQLGLSAVVVFFVGGLAVFLGLVDLQPIFDELKTSFVTGVALDTTAAERLDSWQVLVGMWWDAGPRSWLTGNPFGTSVARTVISSLGQAREIEYGAHNAYVEILFYLGGAGLGLFLLGYAKVLISLRRMLSADGEHAVLAQVLVVLVVMQAVYYVPYGIEFAQALWIGLSLGLLSRWRGLAIATDERSSAAPSAENWQ